MMGALLVSLLVLILVLTAMNIVYALNIRAYTNLLRRGMVRVKVRYSIGKEERILRGWVYSVELNSVMNNPVSHSSSFIKIYEQGDKEVALVFSTIKKLEVLRDSYFSVVFGRRTYL